MIIKDVKISHNPDSVTLSATCKIRKIGWDTIYFTLEGATYQDYIFKDASPFAAALLLPSMMRGEDLIIRGSISEQLLQGMYAIMQEVVGWDIGLRSINLRPDTVLPDSQEPTRVGSFFSGGVDSFYTFLKHKEGPGRIDSLIFINNSFDIDDRNRWLWDQALGSIKTVAKESHVDLLVIKSNINTHELLAPILSWDYIHGACLAATGLALRGAFAKIYVPSTHSVAEQIPWGSNLALDEHWSTEKITFVHDGSEVTRVDKVISQIALSPLALRHLRVCYKNVRGAYNCGECDKCLRTMINLYIAGVLDESETFPHDLDIARIASTPTIKGKDGGIFHTENSQALKARNLNPALQEALAASMDNTRTLREESRFQALEKRLVLLDHTCLRGQLYAALSGMLGRKFS